MKNHACRIVTSIVMIPALLAVIVYFLIGSYYKNAYYAGTKINGEYVTGKTPSEVEERLIMETPALDFQIFEKNGETETISMASIGYQSECEQQLNDILESQNRLLWGKALFKPESYTVLPVVTYEKELTIEQIKNLNCYERAKGENNPRIEIQKGTDGYELFDNTENRLEPEKLVNVILDAIDRGEKQIDLNEADCYREYSLSDQMLAKKELFKKVDAVQSTQIIYSMDNKELALSKGEIADWIAVDEQGDFILDDLGDITISENAVDEFTYKLSETFDSIGKDRDWESKSGRTVSINNATFGFKVDTEAEKEQLIVSVCNGINQEREPFSRTISVDIGTGEIGDTYIEVDMSAQMLYYYVDGALTVKTPVVTGNTSRGRGTPQKVCYVYMKQKNRTLKGANYSAFVNYWMPVLGNIGLHDAGWRKEFGGDIYETNGSHGCINLPKEAAAKIYDKVEIGTPVVMYY